MSEFATTPERRPSGARLTEAPGAPVRSKRNSEPPRRHDRRVVSRFDVDAMLAAISQAEGDDDLDEVQLVSLRLQDAPLGSTSESR